MFRMSKGWTQKDLAIACGLTEKYISELERGLKAGGPRGWKRIADALEVSVLDLIEQRREVDFG
jgi:transcriptional regulator with XRE-family HTH domain